MFREQPQSVRFSSTSCAGVSGGDAAFLDITDLYYEFQLLVYPSGHKFTDPVQTKGCKESLNADRCSRDELVGTVKRSTADYINIVTV